ncbi:sn-glycerol-3-phosphate ABC transporter permease UgpA [Bosea sp. 2KB_26]|uniref:sn-glycerol-3-phosphate ABC transporter permease UgpA n=1 Tax=Bosea sp. 2KB_26 TaxID=3237475 RepID=UPI003F92274E
MRGKRVTFPGMAVPAILLAPQLAVTFVFFVWPAIQSLRSALFRQDAFGMSEEFVFLDNFIKLFAEPDYGQALGLTLFFALATTVLSMGLALLFAVLADGVVKGAAIYKSLLTWPYAVAPAIAGVLWWFLFNPTIGIFSRALAAIGIDWNHHLNSGQALALVIIASAWKQLSYNFLFFLAGLQTIPKSLLEAAALDGADGFVRFRKIVLPLLMPTTFFLIVTNLVYAFCDTFAVIHATTGGGPGTATTTLIFKIYRDGFESLDLGGSAAQSVILMLLVGTLTIIQFRYIERNIHY